MTDQKLLPPPNARNQGPKRRRRGFLWIIVLIIVGGIVWLVVQHAGSQAKKPDHHASAPVVLATAAKGDIAITRRELGTVTPPANVTVRTQIAGQLLEIGFTEGQIVHAGDFLAQIDPRPYQMTLEQAQGALTRDQALLRDAELNLNRYRTLLRQDSVSAQQLTTQQSLVGQYQGDVQTDQGQIDAAKLNLIYCHIVAPITGRVGLRPVDAGNYVQTSDTNGIVQLTQLQPISVIFTLPEDDLPAVMRRLATGAQLQTTAYDRTQTNQLATGQLQSVDNQIDVSTGTVKLRAEFANEDNALFPNQFVNIDLLIDTLHDVVLVPTAAIQRGSPGTFVYLVNPDGHTVSIKVVTPGPAQGDNTAITNGLNPGDQVVVEGTDKLRDGAKITLPGEKPSADGKPGDGKGDTQTGKNSGDQSSDAAGKGAHKKHDKAAQ